MFKAFVFLFILLPSLLDALGTQVAGYDYKRMLAIIRNFNGTLNDQLNLVSITWGKLQADYPRDIGKMEDLSETLTHIMCQKEGNSSLQQNLKGYLIREQIAEYMEVSNTSDLFRVALVAPEHDMGKWQLKLSEHSQRLHCLFNAKQLQNIMQNVIHRVYTKEFSLPLSILLRQLYLANNRESYQLMVRSELILYQRYKTHGRREEKFGTYMAKLWQQIQADPFYADLDHETKRYLLDAVIELLHYL
ncbi:uncharacterized protein [Drosophila tropicalis]|uniref:uncharacterized protein n=1 Tax=Drosophila tropicalis TaxID=46794 RepID=UPI0035ABF465